MKNNLFLTFMLLAVFIFFVSSAFAADNNPPLSDQPDIIFFNGKIHTFDSADSVVNAVAVKNGKFTETGSNEQIKKLAGNSTKIIDLEGKTVLPGLIDAHCHAMETIYLQSWVNARYPNCPSVKKALENIAARVKVTPKGEWIFVACVSASENKFAEKRLPTLTELDSIAPDNPVGLANGAHMAIVNTLAMKKLGIKKGVKRLPHGATVIYDKNGCPNGTLTDAMGDVPDIPTLKQLEEYYSTGIQNFWNKYGFTSILAITPSTALPVLQKISQKKKPTIRYTISVWTSPNGKNMPDNMNKFNMPACVDQEWYKFAGIKAWVDGENDCRTGYMYEPYVGHQITDPPGGKGTLLMPVKAATEFAKKANKAGIICMMHCSGDKAMDIGLDAYEEIIKSGNPNTIKRIEHFGMFQMSDSQLKRASEMKHKGLYVCIQPTWLLELVQADYENMGAKVAKTGYRFRSMIDAGLKPAAGTDDTGIYLANINPFKAIYAAVSRKSDKGLFEPEQAVTVSEAVRMWTIWAAESIGDSKVKGSVEPGKYADMVVLSQDIFSIPKENIKSTKPLKTIVGGKIVYEVK